MTLNRSRSLMPVQRIFPYCRGSSSIAEDLPLYYNRRCGLQPKMWLTTEDVHGDIKMLKGELAQTSQQALLP